LDLGLYKLINKLLTPLALIIYLLICRFLLQSTLLIVKEVYK
jgi:hypothetical protein